jgi:uncharacterized protein (TIGR02246 family)
LARSRLSVSLGVEVRPADSPEAIHARMIDAFNAADVDAFVSLHEAEAITVPPTTGQPATGHAEIRESIEPVFALRPTLSNEVMLKLERDGLALTIARWRLTGTDSSGRRVEMAGQGTVVSRRQRDGSWRIAMESPSRPCSHSDD